MPCCVLCLQDMRELYPDIAANLTKLLEYDGQVEDLGLVFQVRRAQVCGLGNSQASAASAMGAGRVK